jgi:hypothetical protein
MGGEMGVNDDSLPTWSQIEAHALSRREALRIVGKAKDLIDQAKDALHG